MEKVNCIAGGYEWICPNCDELNTIGSYPKEGRTECPDCHTKVELDLPDHAID